MEITHTDTSQNDSQREIQNERNTQIETGRDTFTERQDIETETWKHEDGHGDRKRKRNGHGGLINRSGTPAFMFIL